MQHQVIERLSQPPEALEQLSTADLRTLRSVLAKVSQPL